MARLINGGTDRISYGAYSQPSAGCVAFRMKSTQALANAHLTSHMSSSSRNGWMVLLHSTANKLRFLAYDATTIRLDLNSTTSFNDGQWHNWCLNFDRANGGNNALWCDGASEANANSSASWGSTGYFPVIGDSFDGFWPSSIAEVADFGYWNGQLSADDIAMFNKGFSPKVIKPASLVLYAPLVRDANDRKSPVTLTLTGTSVTDHPRVILSAV